MGAIEVGGQQHVFVRSAVDGSLMHTVVAPGANGTRGWASLDGQLSGASEIAVVSRSAGSIDVFARGSDDRIITRTGSGFSSDWRGQWSPWRRLPGLVSGGPSAAVQSASTITLGAVTPSATEDPTEPLPGAPMLGDVALDAAEPTIAWTAVPGGTVKPGTGPAVSYRTDGTLDLYATSPNGDLLATRRATGGTFSRWFASPAGFVSGPAAIPSEIPARPADAVGLRTADATGGVLASAEISRGGRASNWSLGGAVGGIAASGAPSVSRSSTGAPTAYLSATTATGAVALGVLSRTTDPSTALDTWQQALSPALSEEYGSDSLVALPLNRRADTSIDRYTASNVLTHRAELNRRFDTFVAHDSTYGLSRSILTWHQRTTSYWNATGVQGAKKVLYAHSRGWLIPTGRRDENGELRLEAVGSTRIPEFAKTDAWALVDLTNPEARAWMLRGTDAAVRCQEEGDAANDFNEHAALDLIACGYAGLWLDNVNFSLSQHVNGPDVSTWLLPASVNDDAWARGLALLLRDLREALPVGATVALNAKMTDAGFIQGASSTADPADPYWRELAAADQVIIEGGAIFPTWYRPAPGTNPTLQVQRDMDGSEATPDSPRRRLLWVDKLHGLGGRVQWELTNSSNFGGVKLGALDCQESLANAAFGWTADSIVGAQHAEAARYNLAAALLTYAPGDEIGDMCEYPGRGWDGYDILRGLGRPIGPRFERPAAPGLIIRRFTNGIVALNVSEDRTLSFDPGIVGGTERGGIAADETLTLEPQHAEIVRFRG